MAIIFELLSKVEHTRLADHLLRPDPVDLSYILERQRSINGNGAINGAVNGMNSTAGRLGESKSMSALMTAGGGIGGRAAMVKYEKWSGDKTRNLDLLSQTRVSINFDAVDGGGGNGQARRPQKELPSILLLNRTEEDDMTSRDRDSILLNQVRAAADETIINMNAAATSPSKPPTSTESNGPLSSKLASSSNLTAANGANPTVATIVSSGTISSAATSVANLEQSIMQMLLKHEKKTASASGGDSLLPSLSTAASSVASPVSPSSMLRSTLSGSSTGSTVILSNGSSSITIKRRAVETDYNSNRNGAFHTNGTSQTNGFNNNKRRKLNGGKCLKRGFLLEPHEGGNSLRYYF
jgi:hypothetical protein